MIWQCPQCSIKIPIDARDKKINCRCGFQHNLTTGETKTPEGPVLKTNIGATLVRYADEVTRWRAAGKPERSDDDVARIHKLCAGDEATGKPPCDRFDGGKCVACGCRVNLGKNALFNKIRMATSRCPLGHWDADIVSGFHEPDPFDADDSTPTFISSEQRARDVRLLASKLPPDIHGVAGIPRSGMAPAAMLAELLHVPLFEFSRHHGLKRLGHGFRFDRSRMKTGRLLVLDDSICTGRTLGKIKAKLPPERDCLLAALYVRPDQARAVDWVNGVGLFAKIIPLPHLFEWNLFNNAFTPSIGFDFDGILCHDGAPADALDDARPLYLCRHSELSLIVTWRMEKDREASLAWLARWGIRVKKLVMAPYSSNRRRDRHDPSEFKALHYARSPCRLFVESDPLQAERIAALSSKRVLCPSIAKVF